MKNETMLVLYAKIFFSLQSSSVFTAIKYI